MTKKGKKRKKKIYDVKALQEKLKIERFDEKKHNAKMSMIAAIIGAILLASLAIFSCFVVGIYEPIDKEETIMKEYKEMRLLAECHSIRYPVIKKWFLAKFPEVAKFGVVEAEETEAPAQESKETAEQKSGKVMDFPAPAEDLEKVG